MDCFKLFNQRTAVLLTKHKKEEVIFPVLQESGMLLKVEDSFDTDLLGTFTGEIAREGSQLEAARAKAHKAIERTGYPIAIASEGSFGCHPSAFFVPADYELVLLLDAENDIEIAGWELSTETNISETMVSTLKETFEFADKVGFPGHGLVVKFFVSNEKKEIAAKGIISKDTLEAAVERAMKFSIDGKALIETDMRALYNPSRMKVIKGATINLLNKMKSLCPECNWPGFEITERLKGLPCRLCSFPSKGILKNIYQCKKCHFIQENLFPLGQKDSDPQFCDFCNP